MEAMSKGEVQLVVSASIATEPWTSQARGAVAAPRSIETAKQGSDQDPSHLEYTTRAALTATPVSCVISVMIGASEPN
jgi:hypothetical protein